MTDAVRFCDMLIAVVGRRQGLKQPLSDATRRRVEAELKVRGYRLEQRAGKWFAERGQR
jgi:hypothetical protein